MKVLAESAGKRKAASEFNVLSPSIGLCMYVCMYVYMYVLTLGRADVTLFDN